MILNRGAAMRKSGYRRKSNRNKIVFFSLLFWMIAGATSLLLLNTESQRIFSDGSEIMGKHYLGVAYPAVSRGIGLYERPYHKTSHNIKDDSNGYLIASEPTEMEKTDPAPNTPTIEKEKTSTENPPSAVVDTVAAKGPPKILIYHTHATESYQPVTEGNFHSMQEPCTVREAGSLVKQALEEKGIPVLHDKTLHDVPSYNQSYGRSILTAQKHLADNPSIQIVIDLHRDAAGVNGSKAYTFELNGVSAAQFSLVVGQGNGNKKQLTEFANRINSKANAMYPGFARGIIEKTYRYNQHICDQAILLELGNNQNDISQVRRSAGYFAEVIAALMDE